jgi:Ser-tRNA(Ala) deacylase AlaX
MAERTKLVYQTDGEARRYTSKVVSVTPVGCLPDADQSLIKDPSKEGDYALITDETIFYVQGGGQPTDTGTITACIKSNPHEDKDIPQKCTFEVKSVRNPAIGNQVLHFGHFRPNEDAKKGFGVGAEIIQDIDEEKRELYSRLHTAGHILGLAINALCREGILPPLIESKASHYPEMAGVEFGGIIEGKFKDAIQKKTDEFVAGASKVNIHWWPMEKLLKECTGVTEGFELPHGETMGRVVEMEGLGSYPCGGTHVTDCSKVVKIEVKKITRSKGVSRVSYRVL